jgi:hypothetical protein
LRQLAVAVEATPRVIMAAIEIALRSRTFSGNVGLRMKTGDRIAAKPGG